MENLEKVLKAEKMYGKVNVIVNYQNLHHVSNWKEVRSKDLFDMFCCWCMENNEKKMSNTAFGKIVNTKYEKKRTKSGFVYDLEDMKTGV